MCEKREKVGAALHVSGVEECSSGAMDGEFRCATLGREFCLHEDNEGVWSKMVNECRGEWWAGSAEVADERLPGLAAHMRAPPPCLLML